MNLKFSILKSAEKVANKVLAIQNDYASLTDEELKNKTNYFREFLKNDPKKIDDLLIDIFATIREAIFRIEGIYLFKVQIMGAYVLHNGEIAEMKTGEGKTLTAMLASYANTLIQKGVFVVTVNEYLAKRDKEEAERIFHFLGIDVGLIEKEMNFFQKQVEYKKDIIYITNSELGFDYLRDNMVRTLEQKVQNEFNFAIIDEADSILIDEARTPLIISGLPDKDVDKYFHIQNFIKDLDSKDYDIDHEIRHVTLTNEGILKTEKHFKIKNVFNYENAALLHRIQNSLFANFMLKKDVDYTINDNKVELIDQFTGRILKGRSYSNGLHQAVEAKEAVPINPETKITAMITYQNLFRMFKKMSGMTGTAFTEEEEFIQVYNLRVFQILTNKPIIRKDEPDEIYANQKLKWEAIIEEIKFRHVNQQPILVGTASVDDSEKLSKELIKIKIKHDVLNAKNNFREAEIIKNAGMKNAVTISTNMAGRGTDIKLEEEVKLLGGLCVIGTNRHESRRIDNQLRGRSGRQGDPGVSKFIIAIDDELMMRAGMDRMQVLMEKMGRKPIKSKILTKSLTNAQKKIEGRNFDARKTILEYDNVINNQRILVYRQRDLFLQKEKIDSILERLVNDLVVDLVKMPYFNQKGKLDDELLWKSVNQHLLNYSLKENILYKKEAEEIVLLLDKEINKRIIEIYQNFTYYDRQIFIQNIVLLNVDNYWQSHIETLNRLRGNIQYRGYAQSSPVQAYIMEANELFKRFKMNITHATIRILLNTKFEEKPQLKKIKVMPKTKQNVRDFLRNRSR